MTGDLLPSADNIADIGASLTEWKDLFLDGTAKVDILTVDVGPTTLSAGDLVMGAAVSQLVPGATSFAVRNTADGADNLLISDAGLVTARLGVTITAADLTMGAAASQLVPGATSFSVRNNADGADNLLISDAGLVTARLGLVATAGGVTITAGDLTMADAASQLIPGATSFAIRDTADAVDNLIITDAGLATFIDHVDLTTTGKTLVLEDGTAASACLGTSTLNGVTAVTISTTCIQTGDHIYLSRTSDPTLAVPGSMWATNIVDATSFDIDADNATDDSTVTWLIIKAQ